MQRLPEELNATGQRIPFKNARSFPPTAGGYGTDPNVITPASNWPRILSRHQLRLIAALSDVILPATADHPAPSKIGIAKFFDEWLSAPYPKEQGDKFTILGGLDLIDRESKRLYWVGFLWLSEKRKRRVLDGIIAAGGNGRTFFARFRYLVVGAYFTSDAGFKAIGYLGNVPLRSYAPVPKDLEQTIDEELRELGL
jgi:Gluconate 2-dehydrogenase subunit 3